MSNRNHSSRGIWAAVIVVLVGLFFAFHAAFPEAPTWPFYVIAAGAVMLTAHLSRDDSSRERRLAHRKASNE
jgi:hypothetical protein